VPLYILPFCEHDKVNRNLFTIVTVVWVRSRLQKDFGALEVLCEQQGRLIFCPSILKVRLLGKIQNIFTVVIANVGLAVHEDLQHLGECFL